MGYKTIQMGTGMENTIEYRQSVRVDLSAYLFSTPKVNDIVAYKWFGGGLGVHRCVAVPNDIVQIKNKVLYINGVAFKEPRTLNRSDTTCNEFRDNFGPHTIPEGHIFVMGDNRDYALDSRLVGAIPYRSVIGKVIKNMGFKFDDWVIGM